MSEQQLESQLAALFSDFVIPEPTPEVALAEPSPHQSPAQLPEVGQRQPVVERPLGPAARVPGVEVESGGQAKVVPFRVLVLCADLKTTQVLTDFFTKQGRQIWQASYLAQAFSLLDQHQPQLVVVDWELPAADRQAMFDEIRQRFPYTKLLLTSRYPDARRAYQTKAAGPLNGPLPSSIQKALPVAQETAVIPEDAVTQASLPQRLKGLMLALGYLAVIGLAEAVTVWFDPRLGFALYSLLLLALIIFASFSQKARLGRLSLVLSVPPIIRILSFSAPLGEFRLLERYLIILNLLVITAALVIYYIDSRGRKTDVGAGTGSVLVQFFLLLFLIGLPLGLVTYHILKASPPVNLPASANAIAVGLLIGLLVVKELTSTLKGRWQALGRYLNIVIVPLLATFFMTVALKIADFLK